MSGTNPDLVVGADGLARPAWAAGDPLLREYYDTEWGMPVRDEAGLYERIVLEGFQSGLSWRTVLAKRPAFREVFHGFDPDAVAAMGEADVERLMGDARIIRNRRKIHAAVTNARATVALREQVMESLATLPHGDARLFLGVRPEQDLEGVTTVEGVMHFDDVELPRDGHYILCGPLAFMQSTRSKLIDAGVPATSIRYEIFGPDLWLAA